MTLQARITPSGSSPVIYDMDSGIERDKFFGQGFIQRRVIGTSTTPIPDYSVIFEPDSDGSRIQVQFSLGKCDSRISQNAAAQELGPHTIEIIQNGAVIATINAPAHYANCRWRWMSARRPFIKSGSQLMADGIIPPYGGTPVIPGAMDFSRAIYSGPMANAGFVEGMGTTGDRPDIGFIPGFYIPCVLDPTDTVAANALYAFAETGGSIPWIFRDAATGAPVDLIVNPKANIYPDGARLQGTPNFSQQSSSPFNLDNAHFPSVSWLPFLLTGDPYYLEGTQFESVTTMMITAFYSWPNEAHFDPSQIRGWAWIMRMALQARVATEIAETWGKLPSWLLPSDHFATLSKNNARFADDEWVANPYPCGTVFGAMTRIVQTEPWEQDFITTAVGYAVKRGYSEWNNLWKNVCLKNLAWRTQKDTGMPRSYVLYSGNYNKASVAMQDRLFFVDLQNEGRTNADFVATPKEFWDQFVAEGGDGITPQKVAALAADPENGGHEARGGGPDFLLQCRGALCIAVWNGDQNSVEPLSFYDLMVKNGNYMTMQWAFSSNPDNLPPVIPPSNPPAGEIHMSNPGSLNIGQTAHATLTFDDGQGNPSQPPVNLAYTPSPDGVVTVAADATGVNVTGAKSGTYTVTASADGLTSVSISGEVALPLAGALHLAWDA